MANKSKDNSSSAQEVVQETTSAVREGAQEFKEDLRQGLQESGDRFQQVQSLIQQAPGNVAGAVGSALQRPPEQTMQQLSQLMQNLNLAPQPQNILQPQAQARLQQMQQPQAAAGIDVNQIRSEEAQKVLKQNAKNEAEQALQQVGPEGLAQGVNDMQQQQQLQNFQQPGVPNINAQNQPSNPPTMQQALRPGATTPISPGGQQPTEAQPFIGPPTPSQALTGQAPSQGQQAKKPKFTIAKPRRAFSMSGITQDKEGNITYHQAGGAAKFFGLGGTATDVAAVQALQEMTGTKPESEAEKGKRKSKKQEGIIRAAEKEQERYDKDKNEFFKVIDRPFSGESVKQLSMIETSLTNLDTIKGLLGVKSDEQGNAVMENSELLKSQSWLSKHKQALQRARDTYVNKILRRDSGAVISLEDVKEAEKTIGFKLDLRSYFQNPEVIAKSLIESSDQLQRDRGRLAPKAETRNLVKQLEDMGYPRDDIFSLLDKKGRI